MKPSDWTGLTFDWAEGLLIVRASKFGKSRAVPLQASTVQALADYAHRRDRLQPVPRVPSFFVSATGRRLLYTDVQELFRKLVNGAGIGAGSPIHPRLHDFRHSFAVRTLVDWYRNGENVQARLPWLATYLGHREPRFTYWYLSAAPELLALAASHREASEEVQP